MSETVVSPAVQNLINLTEAALAEKTAEIANLTGNLIIEEKDLKAALKKLKGGSKAANAAPATSDEDLLAAVAHVSKSGPAKSTDIAKFLEVDPRTISRRLSAFAKEGKISGDKDEGYAAA